VANFQPDQGKLGTGHHLSLNEVVDVAHILELVHELGKILGLRVPSKHGIVHHSQGTVAEVKKFSSLSSSILKLDNTSTAVFICPKINVIGLGKTKKGFNPRIHPLFLSGSIQDRTCKKVGKKQYSRKERDRKTTRGEGDRNNIPAIS
jgi:hypothetical protein